MNILSYPARPITDAPFPKSRPKEHGLWVYEPKYNGWRTVVHVPSATMFNRHGEKLSIAGEFADAIGELQKRKRHEWLDCEALERRHGIGRGALIVLDVMTPNLTYDARSFLLQQSLPFLPIDQKPESGKVYIPPYSITGGDYWEKLQAINKEWGCEFYEGLVAKHRFSEYPLQKFSPDNEFPMWAKMRWRWK